MENDAINRDSASAHGIPQMSPEMEDFTANAGSSQRLYNSVNPIPQTASGDNSQSTIDGLDAISSQTSSKSISSQSTNPDASASQLSQLPQPSQLATSPDPMATYTATRSDCTMPLTAGHKRTADGQVKPPSPPSYYKPCSHGHSRTTSAISNVSSTSSRIGELSSELRTRLSYAMVKVNNGWQSNTIEEVESMASLTGSPASSSSTLHGRRNVAASPRATMIAMQSQNNHPASHTLGIDFDLFSRTESASRTYESFWRDHSTNGSSHRPHATSPPTSKASLGPPADIRPSTSSRRSRISKFSKPPTIPSHNSNSTPRTPLQSDIRDKHAQNQFQKTIQEQDAIETLLFMSSPGNSGNIPHGSFAAARSNPLGSPQRSPLRAEFRYGLQGRRVSLEKFVAGEAGADAKHGSLDGDREGNIDRLLDRISDTSSSDEDEVPLTYGPRVVGRV